MKDANLRNVFPSGDKISTNTTDSVTESGADGSSQNIPSVYFTASAAASGLRILDAVRMLGPSLAKLCEMSSSGKSRQGGIETQGSMSSNVSKESSTSLASNLCIAIHRMTVKNVGKCLENVALSIKHDPLSGDHRPSDGRVAPVSSDVVRAIRLIYPFVNAYKSVTKRRVLPWDPKIGDSAGEIDYFIRYVVMTLISNLNAKAQQYTKDPGIESEAKSCVFMMNNTHYLSENLASVEGMSHSYPHGNDEDEGDYRIKDEWFTNQLDTLFSTSKSRYLNLWDKLNQHVSMIPEQDFSYVNADKQLTLESGRILKARFNGFNENFEKIYSPHMKLTVIDLKLRQSLIQEIKDVFLPNYRLFFDKYSSYNFSKKNKDDYLRYPPSKIEQMMDDMFLSF
jgi:exocyst complex component 7